MALPANRGPGVPRDFSHEEFERVMGRLSDKSRVGPDLAQCEGTWCA